jgi:hypothetical protein
MRFRPWHSEHATMLSIGDCLATLRSPARLLLVVYQLLEQLGSQRKHAFLHRGVRPAHALKRLRPRVDTPHELADVLMESLFVTSYTSHPTSWPCCVTRRLPRPRGEPTVLMGILAPASSSSNTTPKWVCGRVRPACIRPSGDLPTRRLHELLEGRLFL